jgi:hypothetical protein
MDRPQPPPRLAYAPPGWPVLVGSAGPVQPRLRRFDLRRGTLLALSVAVATAAAVLAAQLVTLNTGAPAYGATEISLTGPTLQPDENPLYAIRDVLDRQSAALLRGDRNGYLRAIPAEQRELRAQASQRFDSLTALHVRRWTMTTWGVPSMINGVWEQPVDLGYCFGPGDCTAINLRIDTSWTVVHRRLQLVAYEQTTRPWDDTRLTVKDGSRVTVAGPVSDSVLDQVLRAAEAAAGTADRFATSFDGPPQRYFVYVAGKSQWQRWYNGGGENAAAYTRSLQPGASDVVIDRREVTSDADTTTILTHEFGHVVTLDGAAPPASTWWLVEGTAEYIANGDGSSVRGDLPSVRTYLAGGRWDGTVALGPPPADASLEDIVARYGIALLAVMYLAKHYGEAKALELFRQVVRKQATLQAASRSVLGADWQAVSKETAASIRAVAS